MKFKFFPLINIFTISQHMKSVIKDLLTNKTICMIYS